MLSQSTELIQIILDETDENTTLNFSYTNQTTILYFLHMFYKEHYFRYNEKFIKNQKSKIVKLKISDLNQLKDYENLTHLTFGWNFNQPIKHNVLPKSLTHLTFNENKKMKL